MLGMTILIHSKKLVMFLASLTPIQLRQCLLSTYFLSFLSTQILHLLLGIDRDRACEEEHYTVRSSLFLSLFTRVLASRSFYSLKNGCIKTSLIIARDHIQCCSFSFLLALLSYCMLSVASYFDTMNCLALDTTTCSSTLALPLPRLFPLSSHFGP